METWPNGIKKHRHICRTCSGALVPHGSLDDAGHRRCTRRDCGLVECSSCGSYGDPLGPRWVERPIAVNGLP